MNTNILIVDDSELNLMLMTSLASSIPDAVTHAFDDPLAALQACAEFTPDLILVDYMMPDMNGHEFIRIVRSLPDCHDVPIIMVTTENEKQVRSHALELGATEFLAKPIDVTECRIRMRNLLALRRAQSMLKDRAKHLEFEVAQATNALLERENELISRLSCAAEFRDPETGGHINRMAHYSRLIAEKLGMDKAYQDLMLKAAPMHDIGKIGIPDYILLKPGKLTPEEMDNMRSHPLIGSEILEGSDAPVIRLGEEIARTHHEKYDGSGYPNGLKGEEIPLSGRIVAVADVFDALSSARPYKPAWPMEEARAFLVKNAGSHFCPDCVEAFISAWDQVVEIRYRFDDEQNDITAKPVECQTPA
ncbi:HD domain-containing phosphohydrolase [Undibacterium luofuense]|uniref:HD domain-containing phosphohydrolase n=1 Tax=Undibacterium luofuense TaxID=2828733 RepID=UPI0030EBCE0A